MGMAVPTVGPKTGNAVGKNNWVQMRTDYDGLSQLGFPFLWRCISLKEDSTTRHNALKIVYERLLKGSDPGVIIPDTVHNIKSLLKDQELNLRTKALICYVLQMLFSNESLAKVFIKFGIIEVFVNLTKTWLGYNKNLSEGESLLLRANLAFLETISSQMTSCRKELIESGILNSLCYLCAPHCMATYKYGSEYYTSFHPWAVGVYPNLVGQVAVAHTDLLEEAYTLCLGDDFDHLLLPKKVYLVTLFNTSDPEDDVNVADKLKETKGAWPTMDALIPSMGDTAPTVCSKESEWKDIYVTSVTEGGMFWAQLNCQETFKTIREISAVLEKWPKKLPLSETPTVGAMLARNDETLGYSRFQVVEVMNEDVVRVRALDYGSVVEISWKSDSVFETRPEMGIDDVPPQAHLCALNDVSPPPADVPVLQSCISVLRNLGTESHIYHQNEYFGSTMIMRTLQYLCLVPDPRLVKPAAQTISNIASNDIMKAKLLGSKTLDVLIGTLKRYEDSLGDDRTARAAYSILGAITKLIHGCSEIKNEFARIEGLQTVLFILKAKGSPVQVQGAVKKLLAIFVGSAKPVDVISRIKKRVHIAAPRHVLQDLERAVIEMGLRRKGPYQGLVSTEQKRGRSVSARSDVAQNPSAVQSGNRNRSRSRGRSQSRGRVSDHSSCERKEAALGEDRLAEDHERESEEEILSSLVGKMRMRPKTPTSGGETSDGELLATFTKPLTSGSESEGAVRILNTATVYKQFSSKQAYVKGRKVNFSNDLHHDIRPFENIQKISKNQIISSVIGLLNTGEGGSIYIGILQDGVINGVLIPRAQRDVLRTSVDALLTSIVPTVTCMYYEVKYHQVVKANNKPEGVVFSSIKDTFIIEIKINHTVDVIYTTMVGEIYLRIDGVTEEISMQQLHSYAVLKEEKRKLAEIETLEKELSIWTGQLLKNVSTGKSD